MRIPTLTPIAADPTAAEGSRRGQLEGQRQVETPLAVHGVFASWIGLMLGLAHFAPQRYNALLQEDRFVEWWTVGLFLIAGGTLLVRALRHRRIFDLLVAAFCIFVAGEEVSWGQRLLGFTPPDLFLEHNTQQEFTLHNFADLFGQPKTILMLALLGYGVLLPLGARWRPAHNLVDRAGATPPPLSLLPWFVSAIVLLYWYPLQFTGEWVEAMAGGLFFAATRPLLPRLVLGASVSAVAALAFTTLSARGAAASPAALACAQREVHALLQDLQTGAATEKLLQRTGRVHKRVTTTIDDRYVDADRLARFNSESCSRAAQFLVDPWGVAYWLRLTPRPDGSLQLAIYSMGPNRRRDHEPDSPAVGDDLIVTGALK